MCGILAILGVRDVEASRQRAVKLSPRLRHRGPDWSGNHVLGNHVFAHERLAIVDVDGGAQPLVSKHGGTCLVVNGEIYNHTELEATALHSAHEFLTKSDCEVLLYLYEEALASCAGGPLCESVGEWIKLIRGDFAFVVSDGTHYLAARDPIGVCPMYFGRGRDGSVWFASEMKALVDDCVEIEVFLPGQFCVGSTAKDADPTPRFFEYWHPGWFDATPATSAADGTALAAVTSRIRDTLEKSVVRRMMCDVPLGVLLSGGLDSSLVAAIVARHSAGRVEDGERSPAWWPRLHSFCFGFVKDAPDVIAARSVAKFLNTVHHEFIVPVSVGIDAVDEVIRCLETYDVTTVRASTPMYLLSRRIKALGVKLVLSGEGSDEVFGGYLYFNHAPNAAALHEETVRRIRLLHTADCLRANKSTAAWGLEVRVPFLDTDFLDVAMTIDPSLKMCDKAAGRIEKWVLRKSFDGLGYLPDDVLWRQKEQFSDGVGYSWIDTLKAHCEAAVSDREFARRETLFPYNTPDTKEAFYYRRAFERIFSHPYARLTVNKWVPTWGASKDPSGRFQSVHEHTLIAP
eukprot:m51a1_g5985 putative asparagine synthetase (572) ;mRNA; r:259724-261439